MRDDDFVAWYGLLAPSRTPRVAVQKLETAALAVLKRPDMKVRFAALGTELVAMPPAAFAERMRVESKAYAEIIRRFNIKPG